MSNDEFKLLVSKCYRYEDVQLVLHNNNIIMNIKDIKLLMKHFNISLSKYNLLQYQPQHEYKFILLDNGAELYIDNILFDITDKSILNIDMKEMIYGIFPAVKTGYNIAKTKDFMIPAQFKQKPCGILENTGIPNISFQTCALLHLLLFYKRVVESKTIHNFSYKFTGRLSKDPAHGYRGLLEEHSSNILEKLPLLYIIRNEINEFVSHGICKKYTSGAYCLYDIHKEQKRLTTNRIYLDDNIWEDIKKKYDYTCQICGSQEGKPHNYNINAITSIEKGHIKPYLPLSKNNCVVHCSYCNTLIKNNYFLENNNDKTMLYIDFVALKSKLKNENNIQWLEKLKILLQERSNYK